MIFAWTCSSMTRCWPSAAATGHHTPPRIVVVSSASSRNSFKVQKREQSPIPAEQRFEALIGPFQAVCHTRGACGLQTLGFAVIGSGHHEGAAATHTAVVS